MNIFYFLRLQWVFPLAFIFHFVNANSSSDLKSNFYDPNAEEKFKEIYPDLNNLEPWPLAKNLTVELLRQICINILLETYPPHVPTIRFIKQYVAPDPQKLQTERVIRHAPVEFKEGIKHMTLLHCVFTDFNFFVARGGDEHVFKMEKDDKTDFYFFESGVHPVYKEDKI